MVAASRQWTPALFRRRRVWVVQGSRPVHVTNVDTNVGKFCFLKVARSYRAVDRPRVLIQISYRYRNGRLEVRKLLSNESQEIRLLPADPDL